MIILVVIWLPFWLPFLLSVIYDNNITTSFNQSSSDKLWHPYNDLHITTTIVLQPIAGPVDVRCPHSEEWCTLHERKI